MGPQDKNIKEIMDYYNYKGYFGKLRFYNSFLWGWIFQSISRWSPHPGLTVFFQRLRGVKIGAPVYIGLNVFIDGEFPGLITIEDYVSIGMNTLIYAHSNPTCSQYIKENYYPRKIAATTIKEGAWVAPGCIILAGLTIGENSIVGNPARVIKKLQPVELRVES
jgi:acetyltransferase-like isoleucine patch superfamily enzyme